jgi:hypothetical protein
VVPTAPAAFAGLAEDQSDERETPRAPMGRHVGSPTMAEVGIAAAQGRRMKRAIAQSSEEDARLARAAKIVHGRVSRHITARGRNIEELRDFDEFVEHTRRTVGMELGVRLPPLVVVLLRHAAGVHVHVARRDADHHQIQMLVKNLHTLYPTATPQDLASAIRRAWPEYRPDTFQVDQLPESTRGKVAFN